ncbi:hypothetical protein CL1_1739 [Thermococcus cleftensis]|uniref:Geranylgeranyl transferase type II subunit beta n=1 Tax=Thermococcus cleftensis (strain DSM 27260 / KACC 17922 / CL1) TaxID=163003 RepID=I3ZW51_THECF|nr:prenyltransferase/squalene oxidase repeat-containing protein [Thermococcus cleftensis]AFL95935.1 hypothetical protein CL1_1739 [Thermococcus cleftensis]
MKRALSLFLIFVLVGGVSTGIYYYKNPASEINTPETPSGIHCTDQTLNLSAFLGGEWIDYTIKRLNLAKCPDGGFTEIVDTITPDLHSTYYFVATLWIINETPSNRVQTIVWLHTQEENLFKNASKARYGFRNLYHGVMALKMLNSTPRDSDKIIDFVLSAKRENGAFVYDGLDVTEQAIEILHILGYNVSNLDDTAGYEFTKFKNLSLPPEGDNLRALKFVSEFNRYTRTMDLLGINYTTTREYKEDVSFIRNMSQNISTILTINPPLFLVADLAQALRENGLMEANISEAIYTYVKSHELPDGGFNLFGKDYGEFQGTYYAVKAIVLAGKKPDNRTISFVHSWESPLGGFAFTFQKFGDPVLTYMGVYVAEKLGMDLNRATIRKYLENALHNRRPYSQDDPNPLYYVYLTYERLNLTMGQNDREYLKNETVRLMKLYSSGRVDSILYDPSWISLIRLGNALGVTFSSKTKADLVNVILSKRNPDGTFGTYKNDTPMTLFQTVNAVVLLHELGYDYRDDKTIQYLNSLMHDGGWGGPDLYNTFGAVQALIYMNYCPKDISDIIAFLRSLKYKYGGFNFYQGSTSYGGLQETYLALRILELLGAT